MIVYVIERGEYSDRYVHAVVEDEELAKKVVERLNEYYAKDYEYKYIIHPKYGNIENSKFVICSFKPKLKNHLNSEPKWCPIKKCNKESATDENSN